MKVTNKVAYIGGAILAVITAVIAYLHTQSILSTAWSAGLAGIVPFVGVFGIQMLSPSAIVSKLPAHIAAAVGTGLSGLNVLILTLHIPGWVQILVGASDAAAGALGIVVTGVALSKAVQAALGTPKRPVVSASSEASWSLAALPLYPLLQVVVWVLRRVFGVRV